MRTALLVIDVQESFRHTPLWRATWNPDIVDDVNRLIEICRERGDLVVRVFHTDPGSGSPFDPASGHVVPMLGLTPQRADEPVVTKTAHNAFTTTNLRQLLTRHEVGHVVVCGMRTEQCCETTARLASDYGYEVTFVTEATATHPVPHRDAPAGRSLEEVLADPATLPADAVVERTEYALAGRFARIATIDDVAAAAGREALSVG